MQYWGMTLIGLWTTRPRWLAWKQNKYLTPQRFAKNITTNEKKTAKLIMSIIAKGSNFGQSWTPEQTTCQIVYALKRFCRKIKMFRTIWTSSICYWSKENENTKCNISKSSQSFFCQFILTQDFFKSRNCFAKMDEEIFSWALQRNRRWCSMFS